MAQVTQAPDQSPMTELATRLKDLEEKNNILKDRVLLLSKNILSSKEKYDPAIEDLKHKATSMQTEIEEVKSLVRSLLYETNKFVKKEEVFLVERMLKDFQPIEFARMKDVEEMIEEKLKNMQKPQEPIAKNKKEAEFKKIEDDIEEVMRSIPQKSRVQENTMPQESQVSEGKTPKKIKNSTGEERPEYKPKQKLNKPELSDLI